jgi:flagellin-like protein
MKGITPIISIIVLLLITVSLAGAAYMFLSGYMTAYTGRTLQVSNPGYCIGGTEAYIVVTNMGNLPIDLGACTGAGDISGVVTTCGDITVIRTDSGGSMDARFNDTSISPSEGTILHSTVFRDTGCTTTGTPKVCRYGFTYAGEQIPTESMVSCNG